MTKKKLDILIKDGDIAALYNPDNDPQSIFVFEHNNIEYYISEKIVQVLEEVYEWFLEKSVEYKHECYLETLAYKINNGPVSKEAKILFFEKEIQKQNELITSFIGEISNYNTIEDAKINKWIYVLLPQLKEFIECLKFKYFKGNKIANFKVPAQPIKGFREISNFEILFHEYFLNETIDCVYSAVACSNNIKHLQQLITGLQSQTENIINNNYSDANEPTKKDKLTLIFKNHGFFELKKMTDLSSKNKDKIITAIAADRKMVYKIAFIDYLNFIEHLKENFFTGKDLIKHLSEWLGSRVKDGEDVKKLINSIRNTTQVQYNIHDLKKVVEKDYNTVVNGGEI